MKLDQITNKGEVVNGINPNDEFYTPAYMIYPLLRYLKQGSTVWCPFDIDESNYVKVFKENGFKVVNSHIETGEDFFLTHVPEGADYVISNPPYSLKGEVFERLFDLKVPFAMLVGVVGLFESKKRFDLFKNNDFEVMYFNKRASYFKSYDDQQPKLNPPFSSVYVTSGILPNRICFEEIVKSR